MKKINGIIVGAGLISAVLGFAPREFADDMRMDKAEMKHSAAMCEKHCNLMELQKKVDLLKSQGATAGKMATKEHLKKDIETYEKKLKEMGTELDEMK